MMELEKSKTLKRRLRRERIAMEKAGDYLSFRPTPRSVPLVEKSDDQPKMTNSAKRAARKRKKAAAWQQQVEDICSGSSTTSAVVLKEKEENDKFKKPKSKKNKNKKRIKLSEDNEPLISGDKDATSVRTKMNEKTNGVVSSNIVDGSGDTDNNAEVTGEGVKPSGLSKEPKKDLPPKKRRFVLFVGNLSYETKEADVMEHFKKVGTITSVRIAKHQDSNSCRGFCHLEVGDEETYLKALSLHHTFMAKRRINVEYSSGQSEEKGEIKRKNFKLQTLNKTGRLGGSKFHQNLNSNKVKSKPEEKVRGAFFV